MLADDAGARPSVRRSYTSAAYDGPARRLLPDGGRDVMLGMRLDARQQGQECLLVAVERHDAGHLGLAGRQGPGLVEGECVDRGQRLQRRAALEEHAAAGRRRQRRQDRGGNGNDDGAGAGGDQQCRGAIEGDLPVAPEPVEGGEGERGARHDRDRVSLAEPGAELFRRSLGGLRLRHQRDHPRDCALGDRSS